MDISKYSISLGQRCVSELSEDEKEIVREKGKLAKVFLSTPAVDAVMESYFKARVRQSTSTSASSMDAEKDRRYIESVRAETVKEILGFAKSWASDAAQLEDKSRKREEKRETGKLVPNALKRKPA